MKSVFYLFDLLVLSFAACTDDTDNILLLSDNHISDLAYKPGQLFIATDGSVPIKGKDKSDYVNCTLTIIHDSISYNFSGTGKIRGRGNTTWQWFPKKPYRIKLDKKASLMGMGEDKDWVLLANFRDPTDLMNAFAFEMGRISSLGYTNSNRFVEVFLNDEYIGLYQLTEQVEVDENRLNLDENGGILISMDQDDGPNGSPNATDNFSSEIYNIPSCIKHPEDLNSFKVLAIKNEFAKLENLILNGDYKKLAEAADLQTFADFILIQELVGNVDFRRPASLYIHRDKGGKWKMGPLWDFDSGYDFDWEEMRTSHDYFISDNNLILGSNPAELKGITEKTWFFTHLFKMPQFVRLYKQRWHSLSDKILPVAWHVTRQYGELMMDALQKDTEWWKIDKNPATEINRMENWITRRIKLMTEVIEQL